MEQCHAENKLFCAAFGSPLFCMTLFRSQLEMSTFFGGNDLISLQDTHNGLFCDAFGLEFPIFVLSDHAGG